MARADLSSLLGKLEADTPVAGAVPFATSQVAEAEAEAEAANEPRSAPSRRPARESKPAPGPSYLGFVRKDTRLREDQLEALTVQARRLNRAKRNTGLRITENTLIRVAVDLLLTRMEQASGDDEATLLESLR